ncbi:Bromodomain-containing protein [Venustampulla echinocandica]|uniref:Bromodomain-containing protein n=1 Tax=Venustampulla echinocandica TaxID=2656787 RepID=A0A370TEJ0_9HELO|nr:Bromodomain-containing protein [Venustampulla echinocandica]RDL33112.1 Bromodomain-containing protein [Venustampulla echinocandica]
MESKRKVNGSGVAAGEDLDERASKRRKGDNIDVSQEETPESTTVQGLKLVEVLKKTEDKSLVGGWERPTIQALKLLRHLLLCIFALPSAENMNTYFGKGHSGQWLTVRHSGRQIATSFLTLPSKRQFPDYFKVIRMPIAIDTIQEKLTRREFKNLTELESYFKRMIANAKEYNQKGSEVYDDAERLRKALSNFMTKTNPAYKLIPGYTAIPTPLPTEGNAPAGAGDEDAEGELDDAAEAAAAARRARGRPSRPSKPSSQRKSITPAVLEGRHATAGFQGLTFQQAQEKILEGLMREKDHPADEYATFEVFIDLPDPRLKDYYQVIQHPVSLRSIVGRVKGPSRGADATTPSEFKSWAAFEKEMKYIWNNAWQYNEDGSEISLLAKKLQTHFNKLFREAKQAVQEPTAPKIKLKMPEQQQAPKITLKFGGGRTSPTGSPAPQTNGANGTPANGTRRNPFGGTYSSATPVPSLGQLDRARSMSGGVPSPTPSNAAVVKNEEGARNSPALPAAGYTNPRATSQAVSTPGVTGGGMPPPSTPGIPPSNNIYTPSGYAQSFQHQAQPPVQTSVFDSKFRQPGKNASDAMITNLSLATHPGLNITRHFRMDLPPSPTMTQQSITINLPHTHYYLQIKPTIASSLFERQYKLFVTCGTQRLHALPAIPGHSVDQRHPLFEARLLPGVNRIEVELIASLPKGAPRQPNGPDVELEKTTIFANLLKDPHHR